MEKIINAMNGMREIKNVLHKRKRINRNEERGKKEKKKFFNK